MKIISPAMRSKLSSQGTAALLNKCETSPVQGFTMQSKLLFIHECLKCYVVYCLLLLFIKKKLKLLVFLCDISIAMQFI